MLGDCLLKERQHALAGSVPVASWRLAQNWGEAAANTLSIVRHCDTDSSGSHAIVVYTVR